MELSLDRLTKQYRNKIAVDRVSLKLGEGVHGLLGANGAGKTTLMRMICGVLKPDSGTVTFDGIDVSTELYRSKLGYLPQDFGYYPDFTGMDFLMYMAALKGLIKTQAKRRANELLELVSLQGDAHKKIKTYSGGMKQRLGIAQMLLNDPKLLILDEPTAGLDPSERIRFRNLISKFAQGRTILLATHIVSDVECIAKEIMILKEGSLITQGTTDTLEQNIYGKVWEVTVNGEDAARLGSQYYVSNMKQQGERFLVRIVSDMLPASDAVKVSPNLEDVFLYYFRGQ